MAHRAEDDGVAFEDLTQLPNLSQAQRLAIGQLDLLENRVRPIHGIDEEEVPALNRQENRVAHLPGDVAAALFVVQLNKDNLLNAEDVVWRAEVVTDPGLWLGCAAWRYSHKQQGKQQ